MSGAKRLVRGLTPAEVDQAIAKLALSGITFDHVPMNKEVAAAIELLTGKPTHARAAADIIQYYLQAPKAAPVVATFQPLKQSRAMEIAQSRIRADFAPVGISSKVADGWRR